MSQLAASGQTAHVKRRSDGTCAKHKDGTFAHNKDEEATCARPLSGWFALAFAARACRHTDVYGFNSYSKAEKSKKYVMQNMTAQSWPYHYFDEVEGETGTHNFDATMKVIDLLAQHVNMTIH